MLRHVFEGGDVFMCYTYAQDEIVFTLRAGDSVK